MLSKLYVQNYAIIDKLHVDFDNGFCVITGETGAGKSILMGALSLILGQRADKSAMRNEGQKMIVEGVFKLDNQPWIEQYFQQHDLDYDDHVYMRREIAPSGKSRAFINDTPATLIQLREVGAMLIDIHSQHSNLLLADRNYQLQVVDLYANSAREQESYRKAFGTYSKLIKERKSLLASAEKAKLDYDYQSFQYKQLDDAQLVAGEQIELESEQSRLSHAEEIKSALVQSQNILDETEYAVLSRLKETSAILAKIESYFPEAKNFYSRIDSAFFELKDIADECQHIGQDVEFDPERNAYVSQRLDLIYSLQQKHSVSSIEELIEIKNVLEAALLKVDNFDTSIEALDQEIENANILLSEKAEVLTLKRKKYLPKLEDDIISCISDLGMENAQLSVELSKTSSPTLTGFDEIEFLFSANKNSALNPISKVASGGEISRVMLAIKAVVAKSKALPAIVFDEIDTGISGDVAAKMGHILKQMAKYMQVISITHLPQIAAFGNQHLYVFKDHSGESTQTLIRELDQDQRIQEIAQMLSGTQITEAAIENAKSLLIID